MTAVDVTDGPDRWPTSIAKHRQISIDLNGVQPMIDGRHRSSMGRIDDRWPTSIAKHRQISVTNFDPNGIS